MTKSEELLAKYGFTPEQFEELCREYMYEELYENLSNIINQFADVSKMP